ncbi:hypothetical protein M426DRAFT_326178 [Hypoxylon sp. CI-4A]|nr:hypothetical protein M426DRAFT_326178 [Hypoxylon sp. CI-4A]
MFFTKSVILSLAALAAAHPGHEEEERRQAIAARATNFANHAALQQCAPKLEASGVYARATERRQAEVARQRIARRIPAGAEYRKRNAVKRDTTSIYNQSHNSTGTIDIEQALANPDFVFGTTSTAVLNPQGEVGPFYVPGEWVRSDLREGEPGVENILEVQFIDVNTCEPVTDGWFDVWNANSTGTYGGVHSEMNYGNYDDVANLNKTALRGIQPTDSEGVTKFTSVFPGHYPGRATHSHVAFHQNATVFPNGTLAGGRVSHIGQLFWDQDLITEIESTYPYTLNTADVTLNIDDHVFGLQETNGTTSDPVFNYVYLGDDVTQGIFTWLVIGVNSSASYTPTYSFAFGEGGGVEVPSNNTGLGTDS